MTFFFRDDNDDLDIDFYKIQKHFFLYLFGGPKPRPTLTIITIITIITTIITIITTINLLRLSRSTDILHAQTSSMHRSRD